MKKVIALFMVITLMFSFAACSKDTKKEGTSQKDSPTVAPTQGEEAESEDQGSSLPQGGTIVVGQSTEPITLNPDGNPDSANDIIMQNVFSRLLKISNSEDIIPDLALTYDVSDDGFTYTFHLREGVKFHDGESFTSEDVKFTFDQIIAQGGRASGGLSNVTDISCPDDLTVVFTLKQVDASFIYNIAYQGTYVLPKHVYEGKDWLGADAMQPPIGTGPFKFSKWDKGISVTLEKNPDYFLGPEVPYLDKVILSYITDTNTAMQAFYNGELDVLGIIPASSEYATLFANQDVVMDKVVYPSRFVIGYNMNKKPFDDVNVRKAVACAINSDEIIQKALKEVGQKATTYITPLYSWAVNSDPTGAVQSYDAAKAVQYLEAAGLTKDGNGNYLKVKIDTLNYAPFTDVIQVIRDELAKVGIEVEINMMEYAAWDEKVNQQKDFEVCVTSEYQGPDAGNLASCVVTGQYNNCFGYSNAQVDDLMTQALALSTREERAPLYQQVQEILAADIPYVPFSEWLGYYPYWSYVQGRPSSADVADKAGNAEFTYTYLDK